MADLSVAERAEILDFDVAQAVGDGWKLEYRSDTQAVLFLSAKPHLLCNLAACFMTFGFWFFIWMHRAHSGRGQRQVLTVLPSGKTDRRTARGRA
jgi:hypothetical protein